ncbi:hypothetical protein D3C80_1787390 [compost metagenome]
MFFGDLFDNLDSGLLPFFPVGFVDAIWVVISSTTGVGSSLFLHFGASSLTSMSKDPPDLILPDMGLNLKKESSGDTSRNA